MQFSCKKSNNPLPPASTAKTYVDFLINTQWVGTLDRNGYNYPPPCCMRVNPDTTVAIYAPFFFGTGGTYQTPDSIKGKITSIDSLADGRTRIKINFPSINVTDHEIYITNRQNLMSSSADPRKAPGFSAIIFTKEVSLKGTTWSGPVMTGGGPTQGIVAYPDMSVNVFTENATRYYRSGRLMADNGGTIIEASYVQKGAMIFMFGFNETNNKLPVYFGVLLPSGDKMMVHSSSPDARLPYYFQTIYWYGLPGFTPILNKQ